MRNRKLGRTSDHRKALLRNMATSLIENGQLETTEMKAKELSAVMDSLVTLAKKGDLAARRQAAAFVRNVEVDEAGTTALQKLFNEIGPAFADRNGGYTRVIKTRIRRGDAAPMLVISGDREMELYGRYEENAYFVRMLRLNGHKNVTFYEVDGFDHGDMAEPAHLLLLKYIKNNK